jgi:hypothetical protein
MIAALATLRYRIMLMVMWSLASVDAKYTVANLSPYAEMCVGGQGLDGAWFMLRW